uniref:Uncharacterized protein n=1 Tax=Pararge aegeria TaxID=116150 RepID=S4PVA0_9NEOP
MVRAHIDGLVPILNVRKEEISLRSLSKIDRKYKMGIKVSILLRVALRQAVGRKKYDKTEATSQDGSIHMPTSRNVG